MRGWPLFNGFRATKGTSGSLKAAVGGGGGGGGGVGGGANSLLGRKFRYWTENSAPTPAFVLQNKYKNKINKIK